MSTVFHIVLLLSQVLNTNIGTEILICKLQMEIKDERKLFYDAETMFVSVFCR